MLGHGEDGVRPAEEAEDEEVTEEEENERAWKAWQPPVLLAGPSTLSLPEFGPLRTRLPKAREVPEAEPKPEPEGRPGRAVHEAEAPARGRL